MNVFAALGIGICFGWLLEKAGLGRYDRIVNVYRFRDFAVLKFLLTALVVGAVGVQASIALGFISSVPVPASFLAGNFGGGLLFGVGMAVSGFCPGTIATGIGEGRLDYLIPGSLGLALGALIYGALYTRVFPSLARTAQAAATIPQWCGVDPWLIIILLAELAGIACYVAERAGQDGEPDPPS
ncbi:MAG TPA: YeeE/YedE thiosulfate transporter family protein [Polyangiaceae bacterium]|jgi:hypothetical protein|nr:YeeE/YedE thiosulfate transporter family protein [Polyangiaceae bacterium]